MNVSVIAGAAAANADLSSSMDPSRVRASTSALGFSTSDRDEVSDSALFTASDLDPRLNSVTDFSEADDVLTSVKMR